MQARLEALREELETGQAEIQKLDERRASLHSTMLRISGAVQVLEELLAAENPAEENGKASLGGVSRLFGYRAIKAGGDDPRMNEG